MHRLLFLAALACSIAFSITFWIACGSEEIPATRPATQAPVPAKAPASHVGEAACGECHPQELGLWRRSHHDLAMQPAEEGSVVGDFADAEVTHFGVTTRFFRRDGGYWVHTEGDDGEMRDFEISHVFGVEPLQQVLVPFPGGRLQALSIAWDARPKQDGGQHWYSLYPDERIAADDPLHWTGPAQNWNRMCSACHSTGLRKGYDAAEGRYDTTWEALDVSCEACHGPGSRHVAWAREGSAGADSGLQVEFDPPAVWRREAGAAVASRRPAGSAQTEVEACAPCHSRRALLWEADGPADRFLDTHRPALLDEGLYHADGQILDEVYVYGSFLQSRMHAAGVACSDCHEPHSLGLRAEGNALCTRCHSPELYDAPTHHHHATSSAGAACVECHMPSRTYMGVDVRRDHGLRVPRPDLSVSLGTPNACGTCHADAGPEWAAARVLEWRGGRPAEPHYGEVLHAARRGLPDAGTRLVALSGDASQPGIVRATALAMLAQWPGSEAQARLRTALGDADPLVRLAAVEGVAELGPEAASALLPALLADPVRAVRIEAARGLAGLPPERLPPAERASLERILAEYVEAQAAGSDTPEAHLNLGLLHGSRGDALAAQASYERAIALSPSFVPAYVNLADLQRARGQEPASEAVLWRALDASPENGDVLHALGLLRVRQQRRTEALELLRRATEAEPLRARYAYVYGVALHSEGRTPEAIAILEEASARHPSDIAILFALATLSRDSGDLDAARRHTRRILEISPANPQATSLLTQLQ